MNLSTLANNELHSRLQKWVRSERKITSQILWHLLEVESRKLFAELGYGSMFAYLTQGLGYSEDSAYRRLQAARLLRQAPEVLEKVESGRLSLTQLARVQSCLRTERKLGRRRENQDIAKVLEKLEDKSALESQKILAKEFDQPVKTQEVIKPQQDESFRFEISFTSEQMKTLQEAREHLSGLFPEGSWAEFLTMLAQRQLKKTKENLPPRDPLHPEEVRQNEAKPNHSRADRSTKTRQALRPSLRLELLKKALHKCEYISPLTGRPCESRYQLQIDHIQPVAHGGTNDVKNLRVYCRQHNLLAAHQLGLRRT